MSVTERGVDELITLCHVIMANSTKWVYLQQSITFQIFLPFSTEPLFWEKGNILALNFVGGKLPTALISGDVAPVHPFWRLAVESIYLVQWKMTPMAELIYPGSRYVLRKGCFPYNIL